MYRFDLDQVETIVRIHSELGVSVDDMAASPLSRARTRPQRLAATPQGDVAIRLGLPAKPSPQRGPCDARRTRPGADEGTDLASMD